MKSVIHTKAFEIDRSIEDVFLLFSPEGEKLWVPGWNYENVMGTNRLSEYYVFLTKTHDHGTTEAIWVVKIYDPDSHFITYYKIEPEDKVGVVTVDCMELEVGGTRVEVTYKYIALSPSGEHFISEFGESEYEDFIGEWQGLLASYFESQN